MRLALVFLLGCTSGGSDAPIDAAPADGPLCTHIQQLRTFRGTVDGAFDGMVCIQGRSDIACATPNANKEFELCAPSGEFGLRFEKAGFATTIFLHGPATAAPASYRVLDDAAAMAMWSPISGTYPPTNAGHLMVIALDGAGAKLANTDIAILPSNGRTVYFLGTNGIPEVGRTETSAAGTAVVPNVAPGTIELQVNLASLPACAFATGGYPPVDTTQHTHVPLIAGAMVVASIACRP